MKRISEDAYQALREALAVVAWYKSSFGTMVRTMLRDQPDLLTGLNFDGATKREVASELVDRLMAREGHLQPITLRLMRELAEKRSFPDFERLPEPDRTERHASAVAAVKRLDEVTAQHAADEVARTRFETERVARRERTARIQQFTDDLATLKTRFLEMHSATDAQRRGLDFERLLSDLFNLFDMEPRLAYSTETEQIDGALSFDTDDYIVEAKWLSESVSRETADAFAAKVRRKGKNALGLLVAVSGLSSAALSDYSKSTPFLAVDGSDLFMVLDDRIRLDDLLKRKRRHANETGSCFIAALSMLS